MKRLALATVAVLLTACAAPQTGPPPSISTATPEPTPSVSANTVNQCDSTIYDCSRGYPYGYASKAQPKTPPTYCSDVSVVLSSNQLAECSIDYVKNETISHAAVDVCDPSVTNPYLIMECAQRTDQAKAICLQSAGCTPPPQTYEQAQAEAVRRQAAASQIEANRIAAINQAQSDYVAHQQRAAVCTLGADAVALSINNFWGGLFAGLATGIVCMQ